MLLTFFALNQLLSTTCMAVPRVARKGASRSVDKHDRQTTHGLYLYHIVCVDSHCMYSFIPSLSLRDLASLRPEIQVKALDAHFGQKDVRLCSISKRY